MRYKLLKPITLAMLTKPDTTGSNITDIQKKEPQIIHVL